MRGAAAADGAHAGQPAPDARATINIRRVGVNADRKKNYRKTREKKREQRQLVKYSSADTHLAFQTN